MNYSRQREQILDTLKESVVHPTAEYLYEVLKNKYHPQISLATLYRNLDQLAEAGMIKKLDGFENSAHFDYNIDKHYHFICDKCKKIFDINSDIAPDIVEKTQEKTGFCIKGHDIVFHGVCHECQKISKGD